jgi:hypothetical protein
MESEKDSLQNEPVIEQMNDNNNVFSEFIDNKEDKAIPINVTRPLKREGLKSYIVYTVIVNRKKEEIYRRYSDFFALREKLIERWPGVYIPNIPPKKVVV